MIVRAYCRRSKNNEGKQQFSIDVQLKGCVEMIERMGYADESRVDYVDDGRAGDDFLTRSGLRELIADAKRGDVIICRDQSRLGRDAIEVTLVIRDLVRDRGCLLYYYSTARVIAKGSPEHVTPRLPRRDAENDVRANVSARKARDGMISPEQIATPTARHPFRTKKRSLNTLVT